MKDRRTARHVIESEAAAILETVQEGQPITPARAREFSRAVLESEPITERALRILDGTLLASLYTVELAGEVLAASSVSDENGVRRQADPLAELAALGNSMQETAPEGGGSIRA